jgi:hypothetical protein
MSTPFKPLEIPPGVVTNPTKNMRSSNWAEVNLMRWVEGRLTPVGGQQQYGYGFASRCRAIHSWYDLNGILYIAYLCESNLYVDVGGTLTEITPVDGMNVPEPGVGGYSDGFYSDGTYEYGTPPPISTIQVMDQLPDVYSLDNFGQVLFAMTTADGRLLQWTPSAGYPGTTVWVTATAAFDTTTASLSVSPDAGVTPGMSVYDYTTSQQIGVVQTYANGAITLTANAMSAGSAGDALQIVSCASVVAGAPLGRLFVITNERFVMIFATAQDGTASGGGFNRFAWCDQENPYAWDFSNVTSQAGYLDVEPASPIVTAKATPLGVLFWSGTTTYLSAFLGIPYVYNYTPIAENCTPWSPQSVASAGAQMTIWFSDQGMFSYNGAWVAPMMCKVRSWIEDDIDPLNVRWQAAAVQIADHNEFWWFFPQLGQPYNTRCVYYNYKEGWWGMGQMSRSAGISSAYNVPTIMADGLVAYEHESGLVYPANVPLPWAETFDLNLTSGSRLVTVKQMIPDVSGDFSNLFYALAYNMTRSVASDQADNETWTDPIAARSDGYVDFRITGRDVRLGIGLNGPQVNPVTIGQCLIDSVPRGDR